MTGIIRLFDSLPSSEHDGFSAHFTSGALFYAKEPNRPTLFHVGPSGLFNQTFSLGARTEIGGSGFYVNYAANAPAYAWTEAGQAVGIRLEGAGENLALRGDKLFGADVPWFGDNSGGVPGTADDDYICGIVGPDGVLNSATRIVCDRGAGTFSRWQNSMAVASAAYTISFVSRTLAGGASQICLRNFAQNQLKSVTGAYKRFSNYNATPTTAPNLQIISFSTAGGDAAFDILARYGQVEANPFPTSIMRTTGLSTVTRNADTLVRTLGAEWGASANTIVVSGMTAPGVNGNQILVQADDGTDANRIYLYRNASRELRYAADTGGVNRFDLNLGVINDNQTFAVAIRMQAGAHGVSLNGGSVQTSGSGAFPACTRFRLGHGLSGSHWYGTCARLDQYPTAFTDAALEVAAQSFFNELDVPSFAPNFPALQTRGFVSISEKSGVRLRGVRTFSDGQGYEHCNPGARVVFKTDSPWIEYDVFFNGLITRLDVFNNAIVTLSNGIEVDSYNNGIAPNVTGTYTRNVFLGAEGVDKTISIVWPYWASIDLTRLRVARGRYVVAPDSAAPAKKFVPVGDSISHGSAATKISTTWTYKLANLMSAELISMTYGGAVAGTPTGSIVGAVAAPHGSNAIVAYVIGVNNFLSQSSLSAFKASIANWYAAVRAAAPNARISLISPFYLNPPNPYFGLPLAIPISSYRDQIAQVVSENPGDSFLEYVDGGLASVMTNSNSRLDGSLIHPVDLGHDEIANGLFAISNFLK